MRGLSFRREVNGTKTPKAFKKTFDVVIIRKTPKVVWVFSLMSRKWKFGIENKKIKKCLNN